MPKITRRKKSMEVRQRCFWFNDAHDSPLPDRPIFVDGFAGGGGASEGIKRALGRAPDVAINHDRAAIAMHMANHPETKHYCENIWNVDPVEVCEGRRVAGAWFSPDCTHYSKARGSKPVEKKIRGLAWVVVKWAELVKPDVIWVENVEEFMTWGPVDRQTRKPIKDRAGVTFELWLWKLRELGYAVDWRVLRASDYGAPTTRKRLFIIARCDGRPIKWPEPTHGSPKEIAKRIKKHGHCRLRKWRTAAEIIDWSIPCPSIFATTEEIKRDHGVAAIRPLAEKTLTRIAEGIKRYVIETHEPFIVKVNHGGAHFRGQPLGRPLSTVTAHHGYGVVDTVLTPFSLATQQGGATRRLDEPHRTITASPKDCNCVVEPIMTPFITGCGGRTGQSPPSSIDAPLTTVTAKADKVLLTPTLIQTGYGERDGQSPRVLDINAPLGTVVAGGAKHAVACSTLVSYYGPKDGDNGHRGRSLDAPLPTQPTANRFGLVSAFIAKHFGGVVGIDARNPFPTITTIGTQNQLVAATLVKNNHGEKQAFAIDEPLRTVCAGGTHHAIVATRLQQVRAFLMRYYSSGGRWSAIDSPVPTITTKDRLCLGVVLVGGEPWQIIDIGMRMLTPRELFSAQGFRSSYVIDVGLNGKPATKTQQTARCGNSVPPDVVCDIVRENAPAEVFAL